MDTYGHLMDETCDKAIDMLNEVMRPKNEEKTKAVVQRKNRKQIIIMPDENLVFLLKWHISGTFDKNRYFKISMFVLQ